MNEFEVEVIDLTPKPGKYPIPNVVATTMYLQGMEAFTRTLFLIAALHHVATCDGDH